MSELFKQIKIGETTYDVGANAENVVFNENTSVKEQIQNNIDSIKNKADQSSIGNGTITINQGGVKKGSFSVNQSGNQTINLDAGGSGGGEVAATDAVIKNSLTVDGYVVEGTAHNIETLTYYSYPSQITVTQTESGDNKYQIDGLSAPEELKDYNLVSKGVLYYKLDCSEIIHKKAGTFYITVHSNSTSVRFSYTGSIGATRGYAVGLSISNDSFNIDSNAHIQGKYSDLNEESSKYAHIVGGGTSEEDRKNIYALDWQGNAFFAGDVTINSSKEYYWEPFSGSSFQTPTLMDTWSAVDQIIIDKTIYNYVYTTEVDKATLQDDCGATPSSEQYYKIHYNINPNCNLMMYFKSISADTVLCYFYTDDRDLFISGPSTMTITAIAKQKTFSLDNVIQDLQSRIAALEAAQS